MAAFRAGDRARSLALNEEALKLSRDLRDRELEALALVGLSRVALRDGDYARVRKLASNALDLVKDRSGDAQLMPLHMLAAGTRLEGRYEEALELYEESLDLSHRLRDEHMAAAELHNLGHVYLHLDRLSDAERAFADRLRIVGTHASAYDAAMTVLNDAALAHAHGDDAAALTLVDRAVEQLRAAGIELDPDDAFEVDSLRQALRPGGG